MSTKYRDVTGFGKYRVFSDWRYDNFRGKVTLAYGNASELEVVREWVGDENQRIGEYIWIGSDNALSPLNIGRILQDDFV